MASSCAGFFTSSNDQNLSMSGDLRAGRASRMGRKAEGMAGQGVFDTPVRAGCNEWNTSRQTHAALLIKLQHRAAFPGGLGFRVAELLAIELDAAALDEATHIAT